MVYFKDISSMEELKSVYRQLALLYHPDKGGKNDTMKCINREYSEILKTINKIPRSLNSVKVGNTVFVNKSRCIVTEVEKNRFKAMSLETKRETYFSKSSGYAMLNFKFRATVLY